MFMIYLRALLRLCDLLRVAGAVGVCLDKQEEEEEEGEQTTFEARS